MAELEAFLNVLSILEPCLPELIGTEAAPLQAQLIPLKTQLRQGQDTREAIRTLLAQNKAIQTYLMAQSTGEDAAKKLNTEPLPRQDNQEKGAFLTLGAPQRGFQELPGQGDWALLLKPRKYACPVPGCKFTSTQVGLRQPPLCEIHGEPLERVD